MASWMVSSRWTNASWQGGASARSRVFCLTSLSFRFGFGSVMTPLLLTRCLTPPGAQDASAHLEFGRILAKPVCRRDGLKGRDVASAAQDDVGLLTFGYVGCPLSDRGTEREVLDGRVHVEPLELRLLVYGDEVDVVTASETVVGAGEERIGVGGQVDACDGASLGEHH